MGLRGRKRADPRAHRGAHRLTDTGKDSQGVIELEGRRPAVPHIPKEGGTRPALEPPRPKACDEAGTGTEANEEKAPRPFRGRGARTNRSQPRGRQLQIHEARVINVNEVDMNGLFYNLMITRPPPTPARRLQLTHQRCSDQDITSGRLCAAGSRPIGSQISLSGQRLYQRWGVGSSVLPRSLI